MKHWKEEEILLLKELFEQKINKEEIAKRLDRTPKSIQLYANRKLGLFFTDNLEDTKEIISCIKCNVDFEVPKADNRKFCSQSCANSYSNALSPKRKKTWHSIICKNCGNDTNSKGSLFCSKNCANDFRRTEIDRNIESGLPQTHWAMRSYLIRKYGASCMDCGWNKVNPFTGKVPIELEHIDGNSENNKLENLKLICPNCHALTATYKGANAGNGRAYRRERYAAGKSY